MSKLPNDRPERQRPFHDKDGRHLYPHPRTYEPRKSLWSAVERRYAAHLDRHAELAVNPERMEGDHPSVLALFDHIEHMEQIIAKEKQLVIALREKLAAGADLDEKDVSAVRMIERSRP